MSQSGNQGAVGTYFKTVLYDPISSTRFRSIYQLPKGVCVNTKKIRLLNARLEKRSNITLQTEPYVFGLGGSIECISKISVLSQNGVEIDRINGQALRYLGLKNCLAPNGTQYSIMKELNGNMDLSVLTPNFSSVINGNNYVDSNGWWDANQHSITINVSSMLQYLGICRSVDDTGLQIMVEWNLDAMSNFGYTYGFENGSYPQIAYDVYLDATKPDPPPKGGAYMFYTMIQDTMPLTAGIENKFQKRMTAYVKQYIANMYYMVASAVNWWDDEKEDIALIPRNGGQLCEAPRDEVFQLFLDGKSLYSRRGIVNSAMKQQFFNDYVSEANIPAGANCELVEPLGLTSDGKVSFGVAPINRFIGTELQIYYENVKPHILPTVLITIAEVLRSYVPSADMTAFVAPPPTMPMSY
jgi:hypothetical protein